MPVVRINLPRFSKMVGAGRKRILDRLPYVGLDIESVDGGTVRVEYSPNRPDFGTDFGIARALRGLLGKEVGLPSFPTTDSGIFVSFDRRLGSVRPYIACIVASGLKMDDEDVRQLISLQEDLHNGLGRKRRVVAVGLHDLDEVTPPFSYKGVPSSFEFTPLGSSGSSSIERILAKTEEGRAYGPALGETDLYPLIIDSAGTVLSFPPVINGDATRVTSRTKSLFVDVTSTSMKAGDDVLAVMATTLGEAGAKLHTVSIKYPRGARITPDLSPVELPFDLALIRSTLGLDISRAEAVRYLGRSRIAVKGGRVLGPRYRVDLLHPVDVAEEVALGYGVDRFGPEYPPSKTPGFFNPFEQFLDSTSTVMAGSGMVELMTFELVDERSLYSGFGRSAAEKVAVQDPRSIEHSVLRDALIPSLMSALASNVRSEYPQRVYEVGRVYGKQRSGVLESWHLGCLIAHSQATYSEAKMHLESACSILTGKEVVTKAGKHWAFMPGRTASVSVGGVEIGHIGEVGPEALESFGLRVPVSGFELDLTALHELLK